VDVDLNALRALLGRGIEFEGLDYKRAWDPDKRGEVLELAKDVAAMESLPDGGYIVIGADDDGKPGGMFAPSKRADFDEQRIRSKLVSVLSEPLGLDVALHQLEGDTYLVLGVRPHPDGLRIMSQAGNYSAGNKTRSLWQEGDVFVRRGTSSVKWNQHEVRAIIERIVAVRKEAWRVDLLASTAPPAASTEPHPPSIAMSIELPVDAFKTAAIQLIRAKDSVEIDQTIRRITAAAASALSGPISDPEATAVELGDFLLRLNVVAALVARYEVEGAFERCVDAYRKIYATADEDHSDIPRKFPLGQEQVLIHAYALGAVLVDDERWAAIALLARMAPIATHDGYWKTLLRKAEVMSARAEIGVDPETSQRVGLIERARSKSAGLFAALGEDPAAKDLTTLLAQFDVYRGIAATPTTGDNLKLGAYPNFAFYFSTRSEPAFLNVVRTKMVRKAIFGGDDSDLRGVMQAMDQLAQQEGVRYDGWSGFSDPELVRFID
jgi:hypothetical protein